MGLYGSVNGGDPEPVDDEDGSPRTLTFGEDASLTERTFDELPVYDEDGNLITYSIRELNITDGRETADVTDDLVTLGGKTWQALVSEPDEENHVIITNSRTEIHLLKIDADTGEALAGAEFRLLKLNGTSWEVFKEGITVCLL